MTPQKHQQLIDFCEKAVQTEPFPIPEIMYDIRLEDAFKTPVHNENGYSQIIPAIWYDFSYGIKEDGTKIISSKSAGVGSNLYDKYLDEPALVWNACKGELYMYIPDPKSPAVAFKGLAWTCAKKLKTNNIDISLEDFYYEWMLNNESPKKGNVNTYKLGDSVAFEGYGSMEPTTYYGKVVFQNDVHIIVQIEFEGPYASQLNRIGLPNRIVRDIMGESFPHGEYDRFVDMLDETSLEYYNLSVLDSLGEERYNITFRKEGDVYYYKHVDPSIFEKDPENAPLWFTLNEFTIDEVVCIEENGEIIPDINTWYDVLFSKIGTEGCYYLKKNGVYKMDTDTIIRAYIPILED